MSQLVTETREDFLNEPTVCDFQIMVVTGRISMLRSFPQLLCSDPESICGFLGTSEACGTKEEYCSLFKFLEIKHTDLRFATAGSSSVRLPFLNSLRHGGCLLQLDENGCERARKNHDVEQTKKIAPFIGYGQLWPNNLWPIQVGPNHHVWPKRSLVNSKFG